MQRLWISNSTDNKAKNHEQNNEKKTKNNEEADNFQSWKFKVFINFELNQNDKIAITGSLDTLGNWKPNNALILNEEGENIWSVNLQVPKNITVEYRYFLASIDPSDTTKIHVRKWESHIQPRTFSTNVPQNEPVLDNFGVLEGVEKIDKGWLTNETILQFKFFNNPFFLKKKIKNRLLSVKITPMNLSINAESSSYVQGSLEESLESGGDTRENSENIAYALTEVATLNGNGTDYLFNKQDQFGRLYKKDDILVFHITVSEPENIAYLIDLYTYKSTSLEDGEPPHHLGYHYLLPYLLKKSEGTLELPITCSSKHRPLGMMKIEYVKITPLNNPRCDMKISFARHWNQKHKGLDVGHRGSGTSFKASSGDVIRENTIASLKKAGISGAKWVEFDVQLSKDLHPVIYHDFHVYVSLKKKGSLDTNDMLELPMRELTLEQLKNLKVYHTVEGKNREAKFFDENLEDHQPFPTLAEVLDAIDINVGFNIEVKSAQQLEDGTLEDSHPLNIDKNLYVDRIIDVVLAKAGKRRIVFSSFDTDICLMLRNKQNLYPTMFLTLGVTTRYKQYNNPCGTNIENAVKFSSANELLGIVAHSEDILRDINQVDLVNNAQLILWTWGEDNNSKDTIKFLKSKGIHAIIYDKIDVLIDSEKVCEGLNKLELSAYL